MSNDIISDTESVADTISQDEKLELVLAKRILSNALQNIGDLHRYLQNNINEALDCLVEHNLPKDFTAKIRKEMQTLEKAAEFIHSGRYALYGILSQYAKEE